MSLATLLFSFFSLLIVYTEGCLKSSGNSNPDKFTYKVNNQTIPENHRLDCTDNETQALACLNGGSCFAVNVPDRVVECACLNKYIGNRCEMIDPEIIFDQSAREKVVRIGFISGFTALIILLVIVVLILIWCKIRRSKKPNSSKSKSYEELGQSEPVKQLEVEAKKNVEQPDKISDEPVDKLEPANATYTGVLTNGNSLTL